MQFVILKDDYKVDEYGIEIKRENPPEFKDLKPAMKVINEYVTTREFGVEGRQDGDEMATCTLPSAVEEVKAKSVGFTTKRGVTFESIVEENKKKNVKNK